MTRTHLSVAAAVVLLALPFAPVPDFWITQLNYIGLFSLVVLGLVLLTGVGGLTSFGQAAFAGVGAYATGYLTTVLGLSPWLGLVAGLALTGALALVIGALTLRMSGHYLPLATICWCLALYYLVGNLDALGKYDGLLGLPALQIGEFSFQSERRIYLLIWLAALLAAGAVTRLLDSRPGRVMRALNTNRGGGATMPEAMGASTFRYKLTMFVIAALLASVSGWLYAHMQRSVNPSPFGIKFGIEYLFMAVLGGIGTVGGAFTGAALVKLAEDQLKVVLPALFGGSGNYEIIVFGVVLVLVLRFAPEGLWPLISRWLPARGVRPVDEQAPALSARSRPPRGAPLLDVRKIRKTFGGLVAVNDISFTVQAGDIVGLIGPNGAGKSTTFNLVSGVLPLTSGEVALLGQRVDGRTSRNIARAGLSRTFQHVKLVPDMTVLDNVALGTYLRTRSDTLQAMLRLDAAEERQARAEALRQLKRIGLADQAHELAGNLALGPQRLVEIARALASDPSLLLLDEPAAGLRHKEKEALAEVLRQLKAEGLSLLLVEHDMDFVMKLTDRIVVMEFGRHLMAGTPAEVQASPAVRAAYLGRTNERALEVKDLHAGYGRAEVLHGLSFTAAEKNVVTVIGPNGAGKSTLLGALMGLIPSRSTALRFAGEDIARLTLEERVLAGLALVPEKRELFGTMSVEDNLLLGGWRPKTLGDKRWRDGLEGVYARFPRLKERRAQQAGTLSGGERQMLALGRALMGQPKLLMLDEPSLGLAPLIVREIFAIVDSLRDSGVSILLVEQNARAALRVANHGYVLETGEFGLSGAADQLAADPRVIETYLGAGRKD